ncbi:MAG TPA: polysaccharide biosynthesis tyrosine autokinase [Bryobacteraceae bacterium]|jgi:capsular exopolysaccharide synthesis family protein|nr:polysaccharide biosynthesis tyrosine autokinase [Bryobacteraceae bacterium]
MRQLDRSSAEFTDMKRLPLEPQVHADFEPARPAVSTTHYLLVIWRHKWRIAGFVATCVLLSYLIASRLTPVYEATATIDVDFRVPAGVVGQEASQAPPSEDADAFLATQSELIQSDAVLRPVAQKFNLLEEEKQLAKLPAERARRKSDAPVYLNNLKIDRPVNTYLLEINYRSTDPQLAADVANAIARSYLDHTFEIRLQSSTALAAFMEKQLDELRAKMERSDLALAKFEQELNVINPEDKTNILSSRLLQLNTEFTNAQGDRVRKEAAYKSLQSGSIAAAEVSGQGEELYRLQDRVNQAKQHLASVASIYGPAHQEYRKAANDLAEVQRQFEEMRRSVADRVETDYKQALTREQMLGKAVAETKAEYDQLNAHSFQYQQLKREAETNKALYSDLERRIKEAGINAGFQNSSIRIADLARPPDAPVFPRKRLYVLLAFMGSLVLAVSAAVLADVLDNTIRDPEQAAHALDTSVLGTLPVVKEMRRLLNPGSRTPAESNGENPAARGGIALALPGGSTPARRTSLHRKHVLYPASGRYEGISSYEEAVRTLRNAILLPDFDRNMRSLLVTSAMPAEGKSTCIIHLAIAHAEQGKRTLIIDADLRRPSIHKKLGLDGSVGLSNALLGELDWKETVFHTDDWPGLDVLPAGTASRRASDLIGSMMIDILDEAEKEYDLILVDAPPLLGFAETMQVATAVDGVVVMARAGQTSRRAVGSVLATLKRLRANVIGLVLNEVDKNSTGGYYYYHGDYRKYYSQAPEQAS